MCISPATPARSTPDQFNNLGFTLQISGPSDLQFSSSQGFGYLSNSNYVFAGDSADEINSNPGGYVIQTVYPGDTFFGLDYTSSGNPISLSTDSKPVLLAALTLDATITSASDQYTVSLMPSTGAGTSSMSSTYFDTIDSNNVESNPLSFTGSPGTVTIASAAVPEPNSSLTGLSGALLLAAYGCGRLRRSRTHRARPV